MNEVMKSVKVIMWPGTPALCLVPSWWKTRREHVLCSSRGANGSLAPLEISLANRSLPELALFGGRIGYLCDYDATIFTCGHDVAVDPELFCLL